MVVGVYIPYITVCLPRMKTPVFLDFPSHYFYNKFVCAIFAATEK